MRRAVYFFLALMLLTVTLLSVRVLESFIVAADEMRNRGSQELLERRITAWEEKLVDGQVRGWLAEVRSGRNPERLARSNFPWFEGIYVWDEDGTVVWPRPHVIEDPQRVQRDPCVMRAESLSISLDRVASARLLEGCIGKDPLVSLVAASGAASEYLDAHEGLEAERVLARVDLLTRGDMSLATARGLPVARIASLRHQAAQAIAAQGRNNLYDLQILAREISDLDADSLESVMDVYSAILPESYTPADVEDMLARANRRIDTLHEIREHPWNDDTVPNLENGPRLYLDPVGDPPYLLFYTRLDGDQLAGIQLDQPNLIAALFDTLPDLRPWLSVRDPSGRVLRGKEGELGPSMAFTRILPHLRVGLTEDFYEDHPLSIDVFRLFWPSLFGLFTGIAAILALMRADRQQAELMSQQRDFVARVTHELKTPLAGIRLMAENLEMGAFRDAAQREKYARQIIKESERLGARVDEVLRAAARPAEEKPTVVDLDVLLQELYDRWKPLYEQQGATLLSDLAPLGKVKTQRGLLRDALYNLLDNALKYRREDRPGRVTLKAVLERRHVLFQVDDNGIGVPSHLRKAIFERFRRVEGPGRGLAGGHGLGLYFVAEAARMLGGKVECTETADGGARFLLRIPRRG